MNRARTMNSYSTRYGRMRIFDSDQTVCRSLALYGEWAEEEIQLLSQLILPGMCVLDVGAFIGTHTLAFSRFVGPEGHVFAFEPRLESYTLLHENISINACTNVTALRMGLSDQNSEIEVSPMELQSAANLGSLSLDEAAADNGHRGGTVQVTRMDDANICLPDFIKIDVEGMEARVLRGADRILADNRPVVFCECNSLTDGNEVLICCRDYNYEVYASLTSAYNPRNYNESEENVFGEAAELGLLLLPRERVKSILEQISGYVLAPVHTLEDLALALLHKPQYPYEVLAYSKASASLGLEYPSPGNAEITKTLEQTLLARDEDIHRLNQQISEIYSSTSWRLTGPVRFLGKLVRQTLHIIRSPGQAMIFRKKQLPRKYTALPIQKPEAELKKKSPVVVVPVYADIQLTRSCIKSALADVLENPGARLVAVHDAGPEPGMDSMLEEFALEHPGIVHVLHNPENLGFVASANKGMQHFPELDVILVNSDVLLPPGWLSRLQAEAYSRPRVATVTPLSNNTTICTFPEFLQDNPPVMGMDLEQIDAVFRSGRLPNSLAPTGIGFCMYIRRDCLDEIGLFDQKKFGRGYGEENDFCQRAQKRGWENLITPNLYVRHKGGVSFGPDKETLTAKAIQIVSKDHPGYQRDVQDFIQEDPLREARILRLMALIAASSKPAVLYMSHGLGGGAEQYLRELSGFVYDQQAGFALVLSPLGDPYSYHLRFGPHSSSDQICIRLPQDMEFLISLLSSINISLVHYNHVMNIHPELYHLPQRLNIPYYITIHDYYLLNANPTLTDERGVYAGPDPKISAGQCLPQDLTLDQWQGRHRDFVQNAELTIFPSAACREIFSNCYHFQNAVVAGHLEPDVNVNRPPRAFVPRKSYVVAAIGALNKEKGAEYFEALAHEARHSRYNLHFVLIGYAHRKLRRVHTTGPYPGDKLQEIITRQRCDILLFPSLCPETYSYTLSQGLESGLPIAAPRLGAFPERLSNRENVLLFNHQTPPEDLLISMEAFIADLEAGRKPRAPGFQGEMRVPDFYRRHYLKNLPAKKACIAPEVQICNQHMFESLLARRIFLERGLGEMTLSLLRRVYLLPGFRLISARVPKRVREKIKRTCSRDPMFSLPEDKQNKKSL